MIVGCTTTVQSVPINNKVVSSNSAHGDVYFIQHYVIKCVSDFRQGCVFFNCTPVSSTNKTNHYDITEILLKIALRIIFVLLPKNSVKQYTVDVSFMWLYSLLQEQLCTLYTVGFCCIMIYIYEEQLRVYFIFVTTLYVFVQLCTWFIFPLWRNNISMYICFYLVYVSI